MRAKEHKYMFKVNQYRAVARFVMALLPLSSILLIIFLEIRRGERMTVTATFTIVSIIAAMNKPLVRFVDVLDKYYMYIASKKAVNRLLFYIPDKPGNDLKQSKHVKTGGIVFSGTDILVED
jgi:ABC-type bacteriocin/lantibiotic exporter with double-glycine peptidase domain